MRVVVDTGVLLGAADVDDRHHAASARVLADHAGRLVVPALVVAETAWMINHRDFRVVRPRHCPALTLIP